MRREASQSKSAARLAGGGERGTGAPSRVQCFMRGVRKAFRSPQFWFAAAVLVPIMSWYLVFSFGPILRAFPLALQHYLILDPRKSPFIGWRNFHSLFADPVFLTAVKNTATWAVLGFTLQLPLCLFVSVCLANVSRRRSLYQAMIFLPRVISLVAIALLFLMLMDPEVGQINRILRSLGLPQPRWLADSKTALFSCVLIGTWKGYGYYVVILTAGLLNIPEELYDAAKVDGVNEWQRFWRVTLPLLGHTLLLVTVVMAIGLLQVFTSPFVLTQGGPGTATYTYNMLLSEEAFVKMRFGAAAAAALLQFAVILVLSLFQLKVLRPAWSY